MIEIIAPLLPIAKQSFRYSSEGRSYQAKHVTRYQNAIALLAKRHIVEMFSTPIEIEIVFKFRHPKSWSKTRIAGIPSPKTTRPDVDNLCKAVLDSLNGIAWADDAIVCSLRAVKQWDVRDEVVIRIIPLTESWAVIS